MYYLRGRSLEGTLEEIEGDMHRKFENLKEIARKISKTA
jgi:hypothetical protein